MTYTGWEPYYFIFDIYSKYWLSFNYFFSLDYMPYQILFIQIWLAILFLKVLFLIKIIKIIRNGQLSNKLFNLAFWLVNLTLNIKHKHAIGFAFLIFREKYDCAICLKEVVPLEMGGQCCNKHMYHTECIREIDDKKRKVCILCFRYIEKIEGMGNGI